MRIPRRTVLKGIGGITLGLPFLEGLQPRRAWAQEQGSSQLPYVIFFRQANGPAAKVYYEYNELQEDELFHPLPHSDIMSRRNHLNSGFEARLTAKARTNLASGECTVVDGTMNTLSSHIDDLLFLGGIRMAQLDDAPSCGHAVAALQALTATNINSHPECNPATGGGESIDHLVQRDLSEIRDHLYLFAGLKAGSIGEALGGECISHRGDGLKATAEVSPFAAYERVVTNVMSEGGFSDEVREGLLVRENSINDFLREQFAHIRRNPQLSAADLRRLEYHQSHIRDLEREVTNPEFVCGDDPQQRRILEEFSYAGEGLNAEEAEGQGMILDGDVVLQTARYHMDVAALAVACGRNRSVAIQVGNGNDTLTRYRRPDGSYMENFHYVSHRVPSNGGVGSDEDFPEEYRKHHEVDVQFAQTFEHLVTQLKNYGIHDQGLAVWYQEFGHGPEHSAYDIPWVISGSARGQIKTGTHVQLARGGPNHRQVLNTLGAAVGLKEGDGSPIRTFGGGSASTEGHVSEMLGGVELGSVA